MNKEIAISAYKKMSLIREFELYIEESLSSKSESPLMGLMHTQMGEEAYSAAVIMQLKDTDYLATTYRNHAHTIARDINLPKLVAEICGKETGVCKGRAGNMHAVDVDLNILAGFGIIGAGIPPAVGAAFTSKYKNRDDISVAFFGDGAVTQGAFHESMNLASVLELPVLFVNNNNKYAMSTPSKYNLTSESTVNYAKAYNMPAVSVDGMDFFATYEEVKKAIEYIRTNKKPYYIECTCFRFSGQWVGDTQNYKLEEETNYYKTIDPITVFVKKSVDSGLLTQNDIDEINANSKAQVQEAFAYAVTCDMPDFSDITADTYADIY